MELFLVRAPRFPHMNPGSGLEMLPGHPHNRWMVDGSTRLLPPCSVSILHQERSRSHKDSCALPVPGASEGSAGSSDTSTQLLWGDVLTPGAEARADFSFTH